METRRLWGAVCRSSRPQAVCSTQLAASISRSLALGHAAGDRLEVRRYERLSPLVAARRPLASLSQVQRGDCVVAFSRRDVHALRQEIEGYGQHRCCVVYGALPPDARQLQASLFNTPRTGFNVLAASGEPGRLLCLRRASRFLWLLSGASI